MIAEDQIKRYKWRAIPIQDAPQNGASWIDGGSPLGGLWLGTLCDNPDRRILKTDSRQTEVAMRRTVNAMALLLGVGIITSGCSGGVDGPVVEGNRRSGGETAEVFGEVIIEGDCIYLYQSEIDTRYPVIWPHGTEWDPDQSAVVLSDGTLAGDGVEVYGGGGYHHLDGLSDDTTEEGVALVSSCVDNEFSEVAVFNSSGDVQIRG